MFCKRNDGVKGHLHTDDKPPVPAGLGTAHRQYPPIEAHIYQRSHGRILITDGADICHTGASLKDLGKKIFAFCNRRYGLTVRFIITPLFRFPFATQGRTRKAVFFFPVSDKSLQ